MRRTVVLSVVALAFLLNGPNVRADEQFTKLLMKKGDTYYKKRATKGMPKKSKEAYEKVLAVEPTSIEARWKLGRILYWIGTHAPSKKDQMKIFEEGIRYCQEAIKIKDDCIQCHFWLGVSYGMFGEAKGILQSLGLVPYLKESMEKVNKLNPKYDQGGAWRVLGRLYFRLPGVKGGDNKKAIELLNKAIKIGPKNLMNHRFLAEVLLDEGQKEEAKKALKFIIDMPEDQLLKKEVPEMKEEQDHAKRIWKENWDPYW